MKKVFSILFALVMAVSLMIVPGVAVSAGDEAADTVYEQSIEHPRGCMFFVAGKDTSADGSVLMAYNNDYRGVNALRVEVVPRKQYKPGDTFTLMYGQEIPQPPETYSYIRLNNHLLPRPGKNEFFEGGMNEFQVGILYGTWASYLSAIEEADPPVADGFGDEMWYLILERSRTAREGVELFAELVNEFGVGDWSIGTLAIGDPNEVWWIEIAGGRHWVTRRVPDDAYAVAVNALQIREVDLEDTDNFMGSADLIDFAIEVGTYDPEVDGDFDFALAYGGEAIMSGSNLNRRWASQNMLTPSANIPLDAPYEEVDVFLAPDEGLIPQDIMKVMRNHFEGTELDLSEGYTLGNPHFTHRPSCHRTTNYSVVWQMRDWLPDEIGGVMYVAMGSPCTSAYVPFYVGITDTPEVYQMGNAYYDPVSAFWVYREISNLVSVNYGKAIGFAQAEWQAYEESVFAAKEEIEAAALAHYNFSPGESSRDEQKPKGLQQVGRERARQFLTEYCFEESMRAYNIGKEIIGDLHYRIGRNRWR